MAKTKTYTTKHDAFLHGLLAISSHIKVCTIVMSTLYSCVGIMGVTKLFWMATLILVNMQIDSSH